MFYYYGYMIDADVNGQPKKVAPSCKQTGKCTFNEFIKYINDLSKPVSVTSDELPEVHTTAQKLDTLQLTGAYKVGKIWPKASTIPALFDQVGRGLPV